MRPVESKPSSWISRICVEQGAGPVDAVLCPVRVRRKANEVAWRTIAWGGPHMLRSSGVLLGLCVAIPALALDNGPAPPRAEPFQETRFGVAVDDPYRWMEAPARAAEWSDWVKQSSAHT